MNQKDLKGTDITKFPLKIVERRPRLSSGHFFAIF